MVRIALSLALAIALAPDVRAQNLSAPAEQDGSTVTVNLNLNNTASGSIGSFTVVNDVDGPDVGVISLANLDPNTSYTVFLGFPATGTIPTFLLTEMRTDASGRAFETVRVEIVQQRFNFNPQPPFRDPQFGHNQVRLANAIANGAMTSPMPFVRVYRAVGNVSQFGGRFRLAGNAEVSQLASQNPVAVPPGADPFASAIATGINYTPRTDGGGLVGTSDPVCFTYGGQLQLVCQVFQADPTAFLGQ